MNLENTQVQMRKGILEYCILHIISRGEVYASDMLDELTNARMIVVEFNNDHSGICKFIEHVARINFAARDNMEDTVFQYPLSHLHLGVFKIHTSLVLGLPPQLYVKVLCMAKY